MIQPETLVRLDCRGEVRPGLATEWTSDSSGKVWTFTLGDRGEGAGPQTPTAADVISSWAAHDQGPRELGIEYTAAMDHRTLRIRLDSTRDSAPRLFADPALALNQDSARATEPRDAIDRGADLVITRDPAVGEYVANRPDYATFALPWSLTYVLIQPAGTPPIAQDPPGDSVVRSLARDVVPAEARPAESPFWWEEDEGCRALLPASEARPRIPRITYREADPVAAAIAARLVGLADSPVLRAAGVSDSEFEAAFRTGSSLAYVMALPRRVAAPCYRSRQLPPGVRIQPLIDTRARAIVRRGAPPLTVDWDGSVRPVRPEDHRGARP